MKIIKMDAITVKSVCNYCSKSVAKSAIKCLTCDKVFHRSCAERVKVKFSGDAGCICASCDIDAPGDPVAPGRIDLLLLLLSSKDESLRDKQLIIDAKDLIIQGLQHQLDLLAAKNAPSCQKCSKRKQNDISRVPTVPTSQQVNKPPVPPVNKSHASQVAGPYSGALAPKPSLPTQPFPAAGTSHGPPSVVALDPSGGAQLAAPCGGTSDAEGFTYVRSRRRKRSSRAVVGTADDKSIRGVPRMAHVHAYRLHPSTNAEDLSAFLLDAGFTGITCSALTSRRPNDYSSFKVSLPFDQLPNIRNPTLWPSGAKIDRFFLEARGPGRPR